MSEFCVNILQMRETSYNMGTKLGSFYKNRSILRIIESLTKPSIDDRNMKSIYSTFAPHLLEELEGIAEGLGISVKRVWSMFGGYDVPKLEAMGCSAFMTRDYYVRNYDFSPTFYDGVFSLVQTPNTLANAGYHLLILGRHDGVNEQGVVIGLHFVSYNEYKKGVSPWVAVRMVLEMCSTVAEAIDMLKHIPHAACYNFSIGDAKGNLAVVEATPEKVFVRRHADFLTCVNHFQDERLQSRNRESITGSVIRNTFLNQLQKKNLSQRDAFTLFKSKRSPIFFSDYDFLFGTLHTFSYLFHSSNILTTIAQSNQLLEIDFRSWVQGENLAIQKLTGRIEQE